MNLCLSPLENLVLLHLLVYFWIQYLGLYCRLYSSCLWIECTTGHGGLDIYIVYFELMLFAVFLGLCGYRVSYCWDGRHLYLDKYMMWLTHISAAFRCMWMDGRKTPVRTSHFDWLMAIKPRLSIGYTVSSRFSWGMRGGYFPVVIRAFVGVWFFGIQGISPVFPSRDPF